MSGKQQDKPVSQPVIPPPAAETMTLPEKLFQTELENNRHKKELEEKDKQINKYEEDIGRLNKKVQELMEHLQLKEAENAIYKQDFESERSDRQRIHAQYEELKTRVEDSGAQQHIADQEAMANLGEVIKGQTEEIQVLTAQVNTYSRECEKQKGLVAQIKETHKIEVDRLNKELDRVITVNKILAERSDEPSRPEGRHYSYTPSRRSPPPPLKHQPYSDPPYHPFPSTTDLPPPYINEGASKPREEDHDKQRKPYIAYTTSVPDHIRPLLSETEMHRRFRGYDTERERPQPQGRRMSPAYTSSIPDSVRPQMSAEEMRRRFQNHLPQPDFKEEERRRAEEERMRRYEEEADRALLELDHQRQQNPPRPPYRPHHSPPPLHPHHSPPSLHPHHSPPPLHPSPSYNRYPYNQGNSSKRNEYIEDDRPYDPNLVCPECGKQYRVGEIQKLKRHINMKCNDDGSDENIYKDQTDRDIEKMAEEVRRRNRRPDTDEVIFDDEDSPLPYDPNLVCPKCGRQYRVGEIQKLKRHMVEFCTGKR